MKKFATTLSAFALVAVLFTAAYAAVTFDAETGVGFVGKGDVQLALGLNNADIQKTTVSFRYDSSSTTVVTSSWTCDRDGGPQTQERANTTTTTYSTQGIVASIARVKNQITGYNLNGFVGAPQLIDETISDGPAAGSCPTGWTAIDLIEDTNTTPGGNGLFANNVPLQ